MAINSTLRPHQEDALNQLKWSVHRGDRRPVLQLPTGAGKTVIAAAIVAGARAKGNRVLFTVPAISLIDQTVQAFWNEGLAEVGVIQSDHPMTNPHQPIQVASVQTLVQRGVPDTDVVVVDECHRWFKFYGQWMARADWRNVPFIGLSATPWTSGLGKHFTNLIVPTTTRQLIDDGWLSDFEVFVPSHPDLSEVKVTAGDYQIDQLSKAMREKQLVADVVTTWQKLGENRPTLCFAVDRAHARKLQEQFLDAAIPTAYMDANTPREERADIAAEFERGDVKVVCNVGVLTTGVDWDVRCLILARPTKSKILFTQIIGRALRTAEGKDHALILDHSDTHLRLGMVTDIRVEELSTGRHEAGKRKQDRKDPLPKECPQCAFLVPVGVYECPKCGFKGVKQPAVHNVDGELVAFNGKRKPARRSPQHVYTADEKRQWFAELLGYAEERGWKPGWASHKYKEKFGHWPPSKYDVEPEVPGWQVRAYVKSRLIAYARSQAS